MELKAHFSLALIAALAFGCGTAFAADTTRSGKQLTPQQQRMVDCNKEAKAQELKGEERKTFMSACLKGKNVDTDDESADASDAGDDMKSATASTETAAAKKKKTCSAEAREQGLKGAKRKKFMSACLEEEEATAQ
jgi:hypothetical protein